MKAMLLTQTTEIENKPLQPAELPEPAPGPKEVLVKVSVCGVCHTEIDEIEGRLKPPVLPIVPGHQIVGEIVAEGAEISTCRIGTRVGITWLNSSCGECSFCVCGRENLCDNAKWTGLDVNGGYAEFATAAGNCVYPIPPQFSDIQAAPLLCAGVIGYRALRLSEISDGQVIGLFGFGASAHIVIQIIKHKYPKSAVFVFTRSDAHRDLAKTLGADWTGAPTEIPPEKLDRAIDFTPIGQTVKNALAVSQKGAILVINAIRKVTCIPEMDYGRFLWHERQIKSVANVTAEDARQFLPLAAEAKIKPTVQEFELSQANEALIQLKGAEIEAAAVIRIHSS
jgi:propanol-preferring alcohol dehydrogenase